MWHLIGWSVDVYLLISHWEFFYACLEIVLGHWYDWLSLLGLPMPRFFPCFIAIFVSDIDMVDCCWLIILRCLAHRLCFCHDCSDHLACIYSLLYIIWLYGLILMPVYYLDRLRSWRLYHYSSWLSYLVCGHGDISVLCLIVCHMIVLFLHDCMSFFHVGRTIIPFPPTLLVSVIPFILVLIFASVRSCVVCYSNQAKD